MKSNMNPAGIPNTPMWENVLGFFGFLLLCLGFTYLGWVALTEQQTPPEIAFHINEINTLENGYLVQLEISNSGSQSIAALHFEGHLVLQEGEPEISSGTVDYVPAHSKSNIGLFFENDPGKGELKFKALGYQEP